MSSYPKQTSDSDWSDVVRDSNARYSVHDDVKSLLVQACSDFVPLINSGIDITSLGLHLMDLFVQKNKVFWSQKKIIQNKRSSDLVTIEHPSFTKKSIREKNRGAQRLDLCDSSSMLISIITEFEFEGDSVLAILACALLFTLTCVSSSFPVTQIHHELVLPRACSWSTENSVFFTVSTYLFISSSKFRTNLQKIQIMHETTQTDRFIDLTVPLSPVFSSYQKRVSEMDTKDNHNRMEPLVLDGNSLHGDYDPRSLDWATLEHFF